MAKSTPKKLEYNRQRRAKFTPEQKRAASEHWRLWSQHKRLTDVAYLTRVRATGKRQTHKHQAARAASMRERHVTARMACLRAYSGPEPFCVCCGESELVFLTIDHINDRRNDVGVRVGGNRQSVSLLLWLVRMQFPYGFQVLCFNCNCARAQRGACPHELKRDAEIAEMAV